MEKDKMSTQLMEHVNDYVMIQNLIPTDLCRSLIRESSSPKKKWSKHSWSQYGHDSYSMPEKELDVLPSTRDQYKSVSQYIKIALENYQKKYTREKAKTNPGWFNHIFYGKFNKMKVGTLMRTHHDHIHTLFDDKLKGVPLISIIGLLNDNYEGGGFMCRDKEIKLRRGDILLFPSNFMYPHGVKKVTKGMRFSFVSWAF